MNSRQSIAFWSVLAGVFFMLFFLVGRRSPTPIKLASCSLIGYTNLSGTNLVLFQVTNETAYRLVCFVLPRMVVPAIKGEVILKDRYPATAPVFMSSHQAHTFMVPCATDTNLLYVRFSLETTEFGAPRWKRTFMNLLKRIGLRTGNNLLYQMDSPPFGKGEMNSNRLENAIN